MPVLEDGRVRMMTGVGNKAGFYSDDDVETVQLLGNQAWRIVSRSYLDESFNGNNWWNVRQKTLRSINEQLKHQAHVAAGQLQMLEQIKRLHV